MSFTQSISNLKSVNMSRKTNSADEAQGQNVEKLFLSISGSCYTTIDVTSQNCIHHRKCCLLKYSTKKYKVHKNISLRTCVTDLYHAMEDDKSL